VDRGGCSDFVWVISEPTGVPRRAPNVGGMPSTRPCVRGPSRRRLLGLAAAAAAMPLFGPTLFGRAQAAVPQDIRFRALRAGSQIGDHKISFRTDGNRLVVETNVEMVVRVLMFTAFRFKHQSEEVWESGRLLSINSVTDDDGTFLRVSGGAVADGFRIVGPEGPFLAATTLMTSNTLWDRRVVREDRLLDAQRGGEIGLVAKQLDDEQVATPRGPTRASCYQMITPPCAGRLFYDAEGRWVKALFELRGESIEYALAT
jgi:hypothetical protein